MDNKQFKICEILGVDVNEKFRIKLDEQISKDEYFINDRGRLVYEDYLGYHTDVGSTFITSLINEEFEIYKGE